jgi:hypothetical protein
MSTILPLTPFRNLSIIYIGNVREKIINKLAKGAHCDYMSEIYGEDQQGHRSARDPNGQGVAYFG